MIKKFFTSLTLITFALSLGGCAALGVVQDRIEERVRGLAMEYCVISSGAQTYPQGGGQQCARGSGMGGHRMPR